MRLVEEFKNAAIIIISAQDRIGDMFLPRFGQLFLDFVYLKQLNRSIDGPGTFNVRAA